MKYCRYVMKYYCNYVSSLYETYMYLYVLIYFWKCRYGDGLLARPSYRLEPQVLLCSCWAPSLEVLRPRPPGEAISIHHDWCDRYVMKYYCLSLMYSSVFVCFDSFVYCRLHEFGLLTMGRLVEGGLVQLDRSVLTALVDRWRPETHTFHLLCGRWLLRCRTWPTSSASLSSVRL